MHLLIMNVIVNDALLKSKIYFFVCAFLGEITMGFLMIEYVTMAFFMMEFITMAFLSTIK